jgi:RimJ/RimL family protein N-acetyltransferase
MLSDGLAHLSRESIQRRFLGPKRRFTAKELRYLTEVDGWNHVALVAELPGIPSGRFIGVVRYVRLVDQPDAAEVAFVVADDFHRRGVATVLAEELAQRARMRGIKRFTATMASDNVAAHRLLQRLTKNLQEQYTGYGMSELVLDLAA